MEKSGELSKRIWSRYEFGTCFCGTFQWFQYIVQDFSILVGQVQHRNTSPPSVCLFQPVYLACKLSDTWAHPSVCLQHSSFDGGVWLTLIIDGTNTNQKSFAWTFPVWPGFTSDCTWQTQCYSFTPSPHNLCFVFLFICWTILPCTFKHPF